MKNFRLLLLNIKNYLLFVGCFLPLIATIFIMSSTPPVDRDALTHHLAVPKLYIEHGGIYEIPHIEFSYYPQFVELIYAIPIYFKNDIIPKYVHFIFALLTSFLIYLFLRNRVTSFIAASGALFFLSIPVIVKLSVSAYVDLGLIFFSFLSIFFLLKWFRLDKIKCLLYSAFSCGLAMSCKYNGLIVFLLMSFSVLWLAAKKKEPRYIIAYLLLFWLLSTLVYSPWLIKNYLWTNNPVYPLYNKIFNHSKVDSTTQEIGKRGHFYYRRVIYGESLAETLTTPVRIFFQGRDDVPKFFDGRLNPLLFIMPIISLIVEAIRYRLKQPPDYEKVLLFSFAWIYIFIVFVQTDMRIRWIGPAIVPLTVLSFIGFHELWGQIKKNDDYISKIVKSFLLFFIIVMFSINFNYLYGLYKKIDPIPYILGQISRDEYIQKNRPEYAAYQFINKNLDVNAKIFGLFVGNRRYYCDRQMITDEKIFRKFIISSDSAKNIINYLEGINITHFIVGEDIYSSWVRGVFDEKHQKILTDFWQHDVRLLFKAHGYSVYVLSEHTIL